LKCNCLFIYYLYICLFINLLFVCLSCHVGVLAKRSTSPASTNPTKSGSTNVDPKKSGSISSKNALMCCLSDESHSPYTTHNRSYHQADVSRHQNLACFLALLRSSCLVVKDHDLKAQYTYIYKCLQLYLKKIVASPSGGTVAPQSLQVFGFIFSSARLCSIG
jgi:hypothetical protein